MQESDDDEERIRNGSKKLLKARTATQQGRLDKFFSVTRKVKTTTPKSPAKKTESSIPVSQGLKRKAGATTETKSKGKAAGSSTKKAKVK